MEDCDIVALLEARNEQAIAHMEHRFGNLCRHLAERMVHNRPDAEEIVNDTWLRVWESVPPAHPDCLSAYVCRIVRNLAIDRVRYLRRQKRCLPEEQLLLSELEECVPDPEPPADGREGAVTEALSHFLSGEDAEARVFFIRRYFAGESVQSLAARYGRKESAVATILWRTRKRLKKYLQKEGIEV